MVRLADLPEWDRQNMLMKVPTLPRLPGRPFVKGQALSTRRIAIVSTAGLHARSDTPFGTGGAPTDYRVIPGDAAGSDLVMSHLSVNFDRSGFQEDWNFVFPIDRLKELVREGVVGAVARFHYSFMGAVSPVTRYEAKAQELAGLLKKDEVDGVVLCPV
jgi:D-proline reductase (dithiol) PrdB